MSGAKVLSDGMTDEPGLRLVLPASTERAAARNIGRCLPDDWMAPPASKWPLGKVPVRIEARQISGVLIGEIREHGFTPVQGLS